MNYLIIGDGRLARHFKHYLSLLQLNVFSWSRKNTLLELEILFARADRVLLLISDSAIATFIEQHDYLKTKTLIHCSGTLSLETAISAHPLNTFGPDLYDLETYEKTPFVLELGRGDFNSLFPELTNPHYYIAPEKKALYHSLCVMSGNFTSLLWQNIFDLFEKNLHLPRAVLLPYLVQTHLNLLTNSTTALTGPLARNDRQTIIRNLDALTGMPEQSLYFAFLNYVIEKNKIRGEHAHERLNV